MVAWVPDRPTKLGIMPRTGSAADVAWFEADPRHMMHEANVWEADGRIIADVATAEGTALFPDVHGRRRSHAETLQSLRRWTIDPAAGLLDEQILNDRDIQFPRPDDRLMTRPSRQVFTNSNLHSVDGRADGMDSVLRIDTATGAEDLYHFGAGAAAGELLFATRRVRPTPNWWCSTPARSPPARWPGCGFRSRFPADSTAAITASTTRSINRR